MNLERERLASVMDWISRSEPRNRTIILHMLREGRTVEEIDSQRKGIEAFDSGFKAAKAEEVNTQESR